MPKDVVLHEYDPDWCRLFARIRAHTEEAVREIALAVEHVGSTAVPGLVAKPIIDVDVVVASDGHVD